MSSIASSKSPIAEDILLPQEDTPSSPQRDEWNLGWWDIFPTLTPAEQRPIAWISNGIFTAHPHLPRVLFRSFPSPKASTTLPPSPGLDGQYAPPTSIAVSHKEQYVFAYFPMRDNSLAGGIGCIWQNSENGWIVRQWWSSLMNEYVVNAWWLGTDRQWVNNTRLPPLGPPVALIMPILLLVKSSGIVETFFLPFNGTSVDFEVRQASLRHSTKSGLQVPFSSKLPLEGSRLCVRAALGMAYNDSSLIIASHSHLLPPAPPGPVAPTFGVPLSLAIPTDDDVGSVGINHDWEPYGAENVLELCEVNIYPEGSTLVISTTPLPPTPIPSPNVSHLTLIPTLPSLPSPLEGSIIDHANDEEPSAEMTLLVGFTSCEYFQSPPRSSLTSFTIAHPAESPHSVQLLANRDFSAEGVVLSFIGASSLMRETKSDVLVSLLETSGSFSGKETKVGEIRILRLVDLKEHDEYVPTALTVFSNSGITEPPISFALSPNHALLCAASATSRAKLSIYKHPSHRPNSTDEFSQEFLTSLLSGRSPLDILHIRAPSQEAVDLALGDILHFRTHHRGGGDIRWNKEVVKLVVQCSTALMKEVDVAGAETLQAKKSVGLDILSLIACDDAMEQCKEAEGSLVDFESIWPIVCMSRWAIKLVESIAVESLHFQLAELHRGREDAMDLDEPPRTRGLSRLFIHVLHPFLLNNLISVLARIVQLYGTLKATTSINTPHGLFLLPAKIQMPKDAMLDVVDASAIDFANFIEELRLLRIDVEATEELVLSQMLISLTVPESLTDRVLTIATKLSSRRVINKLRLLVHPADLLFSGGDSSNLNINDRFSASGASSTDIITKISLNQNGLKRYHAVDRVGWLGRVVGRRASAVVGLGRNFGNHPRR